MSSNEPLRLMALAAYAVREVEKPTGSSLICPAITVVFTVHPKVAVIDHGVAPVFSTGLNRFPTAVADIPFTGCQMPAA